MRNLRWPIVLAIASTCLLALYASTDWGLFVETFEYPELTTHLPPFQRFTGAAFALLNIVPALLGHWIVLASVDRRISTAAEAEVWLIVQLGLSWLWWISVDHYRRAKKKRASSLAT